MGSLLKSFKKKAALGPSGDRAAPAPSTVAGQDQPHHEPVGGSSDEDEFADAHEDPTPVLHAEAHEEGGIAFTNKELLDQQRGAILELMKSLGKKLLSGSFDLVNISLPVKMFEPRSYLEKLADVWVYPKFLEQAAHSSDPAERMVNVVTWFIAGLQHAFQSWRKPFNPILGETWEAETSDGSHIFMEQISHHPPISAFQMFGPGGLYRFSGLSEPSVQYKANAVKTSAKGFRRFDFPDGTCIHITYPHYMMRGASSLSEPVRGGSSGHLFELVGWSAPVTKVKGNRLKTRASGKRHFRFRDGTRIDFYTPVFLVLGIMYTAMPRAELVGTARFVDQKNRLCCEVVFGKVPGAEHPLLQRTDSCQAELFTFTSSAEPREPQKASRSTFGFPSFAKLGGGGSQASDSPDLVRERVLGRGTGNWLSHFDFEGRRMWTLANESPVRWQPIDYPLPSDCSRRQDLLALAHGADMKQAQHTKELMENLQRSDAKMRKAALAQ